MKKIISPTLQFCFGMVIALAQTCPQLLAQGGIIATLHNNGELVWTNSPGAYSFSVEWAPNLTGSWFRSTAPLGNLISTNTTNRILVPMFYRLRQEGPAFEIPTRTITIDGVLSNDWAGIQPVLHGTPGEDKYNLPGDDIQDVYLARDTNYYYFGMRIADGPPISAGNGHLHFQFSLTSEGWDELLTLTNHFALFTSVLYHPPTWELCTDLHTVNPNSSSGAVPVRYKNYDVSTNLAVGPDFVEWRIPIQDCMVTSGRFAEAWSGYDTNPSPSVVLKGVPLK